MSQSTRLYRFSVPALFGQLIQTIAITFACFHSIVSSSAPVDESAATNLNDDSLIERTDLKITKIDYQQIHDPNYTAKLLATVCRVFPREEAEELSQFYFAHVRDTADVPMPHNIKPNLLPESRYIKAVISGASPLLNERHKAICLNHLAFVISRRIPYYFFFQTDDLSVMKEMYPHALKLPSLMTILPKIEEDQWVLWLDDDIVSGDFMSVPTVRLESLEGQELKSTLSVMSLAERAIMHIERVATLDYEKRKLAAAPEDIDSIEKYSPAMLTLEDEASTAHINTGMLWVKNNQKGRELIQLWWSKIIEDQHPMTEQLYCYKTNQYYDSMLSCLQACNIESPKSNLLCGTTTDHQKASIRWLEDHQNQLFDQDVLKHLITGDGRPPLTNYVARLPQKGIMG